MQAPDTFFMRLRQYTHFCRGWGAGLPARTGGTFQYRWESGTTTGQAWGLMVSEPKSPHLRPPPCSPELGVCVCVS